MIPVNQGIDHGQSRAHRQAGPENRYSPLAENKRPGARTESGE